MEGGSSLSLIPSVDRLLRHEDAAVLIHENGRAAVTDAIRQVLAELRTNTAAAVATIDVSESVLLNRVAVRLQAGKRQSVRPVFNLTGTILHTNLGRAPLPREAVDAMAVAALRPTNVEFDLDKGVRGDRDDHIESLLCRLTGAEAATVVNNNAAAGERNPGRPSPRGPVHSEKSI